MSAIDPPPTSKPSITPAQIAAGLIAGVPAVSNLLAAFGVFVVTPAEQHALTETLQWGGIFAAALVGSDAHLRGKRNEAEATKTAAVTAAVLGQPGPQSRPASGGPSNAAFPGALSNVQVGGKATVEPPADDDGPGDPDSVPHVPTTAPGEVPADKGDAGEGAMG